VHSNSSGHEAIQIAAAFHLTSDDFASPCYRDDSMLLAIGLEQYELMLQLLAKRDDPFSGGRSYYAHPSLRREGFPIIPHKAQLRVCRPFRLPAWHTEFLICNLRNCRREIAIQLFSGPWEMLR
jgi:hypothetical protein